MVECMVFGKRAKNSRWIHALHVNKTFNTYRARLQKLANKVFFHSLREKQQNYRIFSPNQIEIGLCIRI